MAHWLKTYYGPDHEAFTPSLVREGQRFAIVRITDMTQKASKIAYMLIRKTGRHGQSREKPMHEGMPSQPVLDQMFAVLDQAEKNGSLP